MNTVSIPNQKKLSEVGLDTSSKLWGQYLGFNCNSKVFFAYLEGEAGAAFTSREKDRLLTELANIHQAVNGAIVTPEAFLSYANRHRLAEVDLDTYSAIYGQFLAFSAKYDILFEYLEGELNATFTEREKIKLAKMLNDTNKQVLSALNVV